VAQCLNQGRHIEETTYPRGPIVEKNIILKCIIENEAVEIVVGLKWLRMRFHCGFI
jgi:hypothetical protein